MIRNLFISLFIIFIGLSCSQNKEKTEGATASVFEVKNEAKNIPVVVVSGTPYEMGFQLGKATKEAVHKCMNNYLGLARAHDEKYSNENLDNAWKTMIPYIDKRFIEEMKGLADGSELAMEELIRAHMVPVISSYACSGVAVWGDATETGDLFHIRNLDFTMEAKLQEYPVIVVYKPSNGVAHVNPTFAGYIGSHTGMNAQGIVLGEKGASPSSEYPYDLDGIHFSLIFRTILYDSKTQDQTLNMIESAKLIKRYYLYVSDGKKETMGAAKILVSTPDEVKLTIWKDDDQSDNVAPNIMKDCIYYTMDNEVAFASLSDNMGKFNAEKMIQLSKDVADEGGNLMNVVYNASTLEMWVAYAEGMTDASKTDYIYLNLNDYLK